MKLEIISAISLSMVGILGGLILNFPEFLMGSPATAKNVIVTCTYLVFWLVILGINLKSKKRVIAKYFLIFWIVMIILSLLMIYVNSTDSSGGILALFVILLWGQWYGIRFFVESFVGIDIIVLVISLIMCTLSAIAFKCSKQK